MVELYLAKPALVPGDRWEAPRELISKESGPLQPALEDSKTLPQ